MSSTTTVDAAFLGLELDPTGETGSVTLHRHLMTPVQTLYGGGALAIACTAMQSLTSRPTVWCTAQIVSTASLGERIDIQVRPVKRGRRTTQVEVTGVVDDREVFRASGATGGGEPAMSATFSTMPVVTHFDDSPPAAWAFPTDRERTYFGSIEVRDATVIRADGAVPSRALWARLLRGGATWSPAMMAFIADIVSQEIVLAIDRALGGRRPGGSLDNSIRAGATSASEWLLVALHPEFVHQGYGHGTVRLWAPDGELVGLGGQTFALRGSDPPATSEHGSDAGQT